MKRITAWTMKIEQNYPPGYEYRRELAIVAGLTLLSVCFSMQFFVRLSTAVHTLYYYNYFSGTRYLRPDAVAEPFHLVTRGIWSAFWIPALSQLAAAAFHYYYYYRDTHSIYLMRRLPSKKFLLKSCLAMPLYGLAALTLITALLWLIYLSCYFLMIPAQCMPAL